jgi:hypothetical protein
MKRNKKINYLETFTFPDIYQVYPVYALSESGRVVNFKSIIYPNSRSKKKFTRNKQLSNRSLQAKIFDALIEVGFFDPLIVYKEFPVVIQNSMRVPGQSGMFVLLDYFFPQLRLAVELDSDLHNKESDKLRDEYLEKLGIKVWRLLDFQKKEVQRKNFRELCKYMRSLEVLDIPSYDFLRDIRNNTDLNPGESYK